MPARYHTGAESVSASVYVQITFEKKINQGNPKLGIGATCSGLKRHMPFHVRERRAVQVKKPLLKNTAQTPASLNKAIRP